MKRRNKYTMVENLAFVSGIIGGWGLSQLVMKNYMYFFISTAMMIFLLVLCVLISKKER